MPIAKLKPDLAIVPATVASGACSFILFIPFSATAGLDLKNLVVLAAFGATSFCLAFVFYLAGARRLPSGETALIGTIEIFLAPLWVWLLFSETPTTPTVIGGSIILAAVGMHIVGARCLCRSVDALLSG